MLHSQYSFHSPPPPEYFQPTPRILNKRAKDPVYERLARSADVARRVPISHLKIKNIRIKLTGKISIHLRMFLVVTTYFLVLIYQDVFFRTRTECSCVVQRYSNPPAKLQILTCNKSIVFEQDLSKPKICCKKCTKITGSQKKISCRICLLVL